MKHKPPKSLTPDTGISANPSNGNEAVNSSVPDQSSQNQTQNNATLSQTQTKNNSTPSKTQLPDYVLLITDSNGKRFKPDLLCPTSNVESQIKYKLKDVQKHIDDCQHIPKTVIIHCGTNDLESEDTAKVIQECKSLLQSIKKKFSNSRIIYSSLLPRQDFYQDDVEEINKCIKDFCISENIAFVENNNISKPNLFHDHKHLNDTGVKFFAKNIKSAYYETPTKESTKKRRVQRTSRVSYHPQRQSHPENRNIRYPKPHYELPYMHMMRPPQPTKQQHLSSSPTSPRQQHHPLSNLPPAQQDPRQQPHPYSVPSQPVQQQPPYLYAQVAKSNVHNPTRNQPPPVMDLQFIIKQLQMLAQTVK